LLCKPWFGGQARWCSRWRPVMTCGRTAYRTGCRSRFWWLALRSSPLVAGCQVSGAAWPELHSMAHWRHGHGRRQARDGCGGLDRSSSFCHSVHLYLPCRGCSGGRVGAVARLVGRQSGLNGRPADVLAGSRAGVKDKSAGAHYRDGNSVRACHRDRNPAFASGAMKYVERQDCIGGPSGAAREND
jgi:hypothetical protein